MFMASSLLILVHLACIYLLGPRVVRATESIQDVTMRDRDLPLGLFDYLSSYCD